jgi:hypothetical protein
MCTNVGVLFVLTGVATCSTKVNTIMRHVCAHLVAQMEELKAAGVSVIAVSWWGRESVAGTADTQVAQHLLPPKVKQIEIK